MKHRVVSYCALLLRPFGMNKRYAILLLVSGAGWFLVAGVIGYAIPVFGSMWVQHFVCAMLSAFVTGTVFRVPMLRWSGWRWYLLPLLTSLAGTTLFGFLLICSWNLTEPGGVESCAFSMFPLAIAFYMITGGWILLYPIALLWQHLLRKGWTSGEPTKLA